MGNIKNTYLFLLLPLWKLKWWVFDFRWMDSRSLWLWLLYSDPHPKKLRIPRGEDRKKSMEDTLEIATIARVSMTPSRCVFQHGLHNWSLIFLMTSRQNHTLKSRVSSIPKLYLFYSLTCLFMIEIFFYVLTLDICTNANVSVRFWIHFMS